MPVAFEVSGSVTGLEGVIPLLAVHGRLVVVAIYPTPPLSTCFACSGASSR